MIHLTKKGKPCKMCMKQEGSCPSHDVDLSKRNAKVAKAAFLNNPEGYTRQKETAGKKGYKVSCKRHGNTFWMDGWLRWKRNKPSLPERYCMRILQDLKIHYDFEVQVFALEPEKTADFAIRKHNRRLLKREIVIYVNGYQWKPSFGQDEPKEPVQDADIRELELCGFHVVKLDWRYRQGWKMQVSDALDKERVN